MLDDRKDEAEQETVSQNIEKADSENLKYRDILGYLHDIIYCLAAILVLVVLIFKIVVVSGTSMTNTLYNGDCMVLLSNLFSPNFEQGDIVVISKNSFKNGEPIIKRIIATEGQQVDIDFEKGVVYVDGIALDEPYTKTPTNLFEGVSFPLTVNEDCYFVMGDNRNGSKDSRSPEIGQIDQREVMGKVVFLTFPGPHPDTQKRDFHRIGVVKHG